VCVSAMGLGSCPWLRRPTRRPPRALNRRRPSQLRSPRQTRPRMGVRDRYRHHPPTHRESGVGSRGLRPVDVDPPRRESAAAGRENGWCRCFWKHAAESSPTVGRGISRSRSPGRSRPSRHFRGSVGGRIDDPFRVDVGRSPVCQTTKTDVKAPPQYHRPAQRYRVHLATGETRGTRFCLLSGRLR